MFLFCLLLLFTSLKLAIITWTRGTRRPPVAPLQWLHLLKAEEQKGQLPEPLEPRGSPGHLMRCMDRAKGMSPGAERRLEGDTSP